MSYLVIARKYRPQRFADLVGQEHVSVTLQNQIRTQRQAQAYLFTGPRGVGKTSAARIFAKALRCLDLGADFEPCNKCAACEAVNNGSSMDVLEIDAASNTGVDNIRDLRENVNYSANIGRYRVYIVDEVHMLSTAAFNALLKTIEEPPPHVIFIFATTELHKVPATIQSRCQRFDFRKIPQDVMMANLRGVCEAEGIAFEEGALRIITTESEGCLRDAQSLLDQALAFCGKNLETTRLEKALGLLERSSMFDLLRAIGTHDTPGALKRATSILNKGTDPKILLGRLVDSLCDLHYRAFTGESRLPDPDQDALYADLCQALAPDEIVRAMELALRTQASLNTNINAAITVEALVAKLSLQRPVGAAPTASPPQDNTRSPAPTFTPRASSAPAAPRASAPSAPTPTASAPAAAPTAPAAPAPSGTGRAVLEDYIRMHKPAWTPVVQSLLGIEVRDGTVYARAKPDFAGKRLSSNDGLELLKVAYRVGKAVVELDASQKKEDAPPREDQVQTKRTLAREHDAIKSAVKIFEATITETKILEDERAPRGGKGVK
ncbi:MAG: DNA polymerase III subunit gamma/tau [Bdellovibrionales bacterium]|nr:DNA polymerase III subunit gamma/tau [Bdellovibrionales bacterium]